MENEYSFSVKSLDKYFDYCKDNGYKLKSENSQIRTLYRKKDKTMARITIQKENDFVKKYLDFKEDILNGKEFTSRKESASIEFVDDSAVESILDFLNYKKDNTLSRKRWVYQKDNIIFEFDEYDSPKRAFVVSIEGDMDKIKDVYLEVKKIKDE